MKTLYKQFVICSFPISRLGTQSGRATSFLPLLDNRKSGATQRDTPDLHGCD